MCSLTELFCLIDDFCKEFEPEWNKRLLDDGEKKRERSTGLALSEIMTIIVFFHFMRHRIFKNFYNDFVCAFLRPAFPKLPCYERFIALMPRCSVPLAAFFEMLKGQCTGWSIADSTAISVCDNLRIRSHRVFKNAAARGKTSTGWFYGFKLHTIINHRGELLSAHLTPGNVDDRKSLKNKALGLFGKLYADKGYIGKWLKEWLSKHRIELITKVRKNMKQPVLSDFDKAALRYRSVIESVFHELKNLCQIEHTRHRSVTNFCINLLGGIVAYCLFPKKPKVPVTETSLCINGF